MTDLADFIAGMPKVELHMHLEGSLEPEMMFALARRNKVEIPFASIAEVRSAYKFTDLQSFLDIYYQGMGVLQTEADFYDLTTAYLAKCREQNVVHTEVFFDPQGHTERGVPFDTVISGITRALEDGAKSFGISSKLIMCFLRHLSEEAAFQTLEQSLPHKHKIAGVGLDSSEMGHPPSKFARVFAKAREEGYKLCAHAGEEGPPEYVYEALDLLHIDRIDHGNRSMEDPALIARLGNTGMGLTVCPLSNLSLRNVKSLSSHPLKRMLEEGLKATVNSDDPAYFGGYMTENFQEIARALNLQESHILHLAHNAIDVSFMSAEEKDKARRQLVAYAMEALPKLA
jgi:adenosine deaminase